MRIVEIESHEVMLPYQEFNARTLARYHGREIQRRTILIAHTDTGLEGCGESWGRLDAEPLRARYLGTDPFDWMNTESDLAMGMALYDLMGQHLGVPVWKLLGPKVRSWVPVSYWTVSQAPESMAAEVRQAARLGYRWLKYHVDEIQNVLAQAEAMQRVAPDGFRVHFDFNASLDCYAIGSLLQELERFPVAGRFEDILPSSDEDGYRLLREKARLPIIIHHGPPEVMVKKLCDGYMAGHAPLGLALKVGAVAELTNTPVMYQQCGGMINRAFLAHEAAVIRKATIDHVDLGHLWKEDVTREILPVVSGSVAVPTGPGLGVRIDREKLERYTQAPPEPTGRFLVRVRYSDGLTLYLRHDPDRPGQADALRFQSRLHGYQAPAPPPAYANPVSSDFWDEPTPEFERLWEQSGSGPVWVKQDS
jgi:L-alanine-DL-glutamate epimerase-like enolase superfamily enzyme